jgi:hypothetical protein
MSRGATTTTPLPSPAAAGGVLGAFLAMLAHLGHHLAVTLGLAAGQVPAAEAAVGVAGAVLLAPLLLRLGRRSGSWRPPVAALVSYALLFTLATVVVGPLHGDTFAP